MSWFEIIKMALHNLRQRPVRASLNLLGIVLGTVLVLMTMAGSEGVKQALHSVLENSEFTRKVIARQTSKVSEKDIDESAWQIIKPMSPERRERMEEALKNHLVEEKRKADGRYRRIDLEVLSQFERLNHVVEVVPQLFVGFQMSVNEFKQTTFGEGVSPKVNGLADRIVAGTMLEESDRDGILIHELMAYHLGCVTQDELEQLIGTEVECQFQVAGKANDLTRVLTSVKDGDLQQLMNQQIQLLRAIKQLVGNVDDVESLTEAQKNLLRDSLGTLVETDPTESPVVIRRFKIKGVYHSLEDDDLFGVLSRFRFDSKRPVLFHHKTATDLQVNLRGAKDFYTATIHVDRFDHVEQVEDDLKKMGFSSYSAHSMLESIDRRIGRISRAVYIVALLILVITAIAISNTLVISVMERTAEFGIMKSLGARNGQIVLLMMVEGALLGVAGAIVAVFASLLIGRLGQGLLRSYLEEQAKEPMTGEMFQFSPWAAIVAVVVAILICAVASVIPAWRAARLDPVIAMQKN